MRHGLKWKPKTQKTSKLKKPHSRLELRKQVIIASNCTRPHGKTLDKVYNQLMRKNLYT